MNDIIAIKNIPENAAAAMEDITGYKCRLRHITVGHIHSWDGGYICGNGYTASYEDYCTDLEDMMRLFMILLAASERMKQRFIPLITAFLSTGRM